ncbi:hypothetical protein [Thermosipho atlanticus]|uniref:Phage derived protein Gp49-like n=1 Tax=Thermosipho atlanticus DSM 15807 TaxID=1123380 RepID=A0A1M5RMY2_9BACT|nr:hypothetical protein [Thermosipho atlanticus]SHH27615.1 hypothetical protein SAMN02745199_0514 [Thermosipho atlanticus DSM 15807]
MGFIRYFPDDNSSSSNRLKKLIEEEFKNKNKKLFKRLEVELAKMDLIGADYIFSVLEEERGFNNKKKKIVVLESNFYELRVPKQSKEGVFRVYFTIFPDNKKIMILDAEYKTEKEPKRLEPARNKLKRLKKEAGWNE